MDENVRMLNGVYQIIDMALSSINDVINNEKTLELKKIKNVLKKQKKEYELLKQETEELMCKYDEECKEVSLFLKINAKLSSRFKIMKASTTSHIAKMFITGTNMGIISITEKLNNLKSIDRNVKKISVKLKATLENNLETLKKYI